MKPIQRLKTGTGIARLATAFAAILFLTGIANGQEIAVDIQVEQSFDLKEWEMVPVTPNMLGPGGKVRLPAGSAESGFYRMVIETQELPPPPPPEGFAIIPAGEFLMGDSIGDGSAHERPAHTVYVSEFYISRVEVTLELWQIVAFWGWDNGYFDLPFGDGVAQDHPVQMISWFDAVKWLNAWSEMDGRDPVYTVGGDVYRNGIAVPATNFAVNGYRLPTEAEWEKAARGGLEGRRYSWWSNNITPEDANVLGTVSTDVPVPRTLPVGSFAPNGYGLYDTTGNVWEWVNDWYSNVYYASSPSVDPRGPDEPSAANRRLFRGGAWNSRTNDQSRVAFRYSSGDDTFFNSVGLRAAYSSLP